MKYSATSEEIKKRLITGLREKGYKLTLQRLEIISLLSKDMTHPGAMDILIKVRKKASQISMSTVYYTLDMLKKEGLIQEIEFYDQDNRYDVNVTNHINLICKKCGRIDDLPGGITLSYAQVQQKTDFQAVAMRYEYYGYCKNCRGKRAG
jgi:Fur family transcriptional regulator, peroxide stress response regulator